MPLLRAVCFVLALLSSAGWADESVLRSANEVRETLRRKPEGVFPVEFEATILAYYHAHPSPPLGTCNLLFVHDGESGIYVDMRKLSRLDLRAGQRVRVQGRGAPGDFAPSVTNASVTVLGHGPLPEPRKVSIREALTGGHDSQWIEIRGVLREASETDGRLYLHVSDGYDRIRIGLTTEIEDVPKFLRLPNTGIIARGACGTLFNGQRQILSALLHSAPEDIQVVEPPPTDPFSIPVSDLTDVLGFASAHRDGRLVRVRGTVSGIDPGKAVFLSAPRAAMMVSTSNSEGLAVGDVVEALGYPTKGIFAGMLEDGRFRKVGELPPPAAAPITPEQALFGDYEARLIRIDARLLGTMHGLHGSILVVEADRHPFNAHLPLPWSEIAGTLPAGSRVRLTGICVAEGEAEQSGRRLRPTAWKLILRSLDDVQILKSPPWWTRERLSLLLAAVVLITVAAMWWNAALRRRVRQQTALITRQIEEHAVLEERMRIARELHDTLAQGFAGTAFQLEAVAAELVDGPICARQNLDIARSMVRHSISEARQSVMNLRARGLEGGDLLAAISESAMRLIGRAAIQFHSVQTGEARPLPSWIQTHLFRIGVEAVSNAVCHGKPTNVWLSLDFSSDHVTLTVSDDGKGFSPDLVDGLHFGLQGMRERARQISGDLDIRTSAGSGTTIRVDAPFPQDTPLNESPAAA